MANNSIDISINSKLNPSGFDRAKRAARSAASSIKGAFSAVGSNLMNIFAGLQMMKGALSGIGQLFASAFRWETQQAQFSRLIGSVDEAKRHMADLKSLGDTPPFSMDQFAAASRELMVMTNGVLGFKGSLEMIGDVAAGMGRPIEEVSHAVGLLYANIRDGQPLSRAVMQLKQMGVISPETAAKLAAMQKAGKSNSEIWAEAKKSLERFSGAMKDTETTGEGLTAQISSQWDNIVRTFGQAFSESAKGGMQYLLDKMKEIQEDGSIKEWADQSVSALQSLVSAFGKVGKAWNAVKSGWQTVTDYSERIGGAIGTFVGTTASQMMDAAGQTWDALKSGDWKGAAKGLYNGSIGAYVKGGKAAAADYKATGQAQAIYNEEAKKEAEAKKQAEEEARKERIAKAKEEAKKKAEAEANAKKEEEAKIQEDLQRAQEIINQRLARERAIANLNQQLETNKKSQQDWKDRLTQAGKSKKWQDVGIATDHAKHNGISGPYQYSTDANGNIADFRQWQRARRYAGRADRDAATAESKADRSDARRAAALQKRLDNGKGISERDQKFLDDWNEYQNQLNAEKEAREKLVTLQEESKSLQERIATATEELKTFLESALEVS